MHIYADNVTRMNDMLSRGKSIANQTALQKNLFFFFNKMYSMAQMQKVVY